MSSDLRAVFYEDAACCAFVGAMIGVEDFGNCRTIGFLDADGLLEAAVVYNNWNPKSGVIEINAAARNRAWGTRGRLRLIFEYPFAFARMVVARTSGNNPGPLRIWRALGAKEYRVEGLRGPDEDEIIHTMTVDHWRSSRWAHPAQE